MRICLIGVLLCACGGGDPGPPCPDVCANFTAICTDVTESECLADCESDFDRRTRECLLTARSCSTATSSCLREGECGDRVVDRGEECDDGNTVGGDGCSSTCMSEGGADSGVDGACEAMCEGVCTSLSSDNLNCGECGMFCSLDESCVAGICETDPALRFTLEWDVPGNLDLHVVRPDGVEIYWMAMSPPTGPGGLDGALDRDDQTGTGPERITFEMPSAGAYLICVNPREIGARTDWTMTVERDGSVERVVNRRDSESVASFNCTEGDADLEYNLL